MHESLAERSRDNRCQHATPTIRRNPRLEKRRKVSSAAKPVFKAQDHVPRTRHTQETPKPSQHTTTNLRVLLVAEHERLDREIRRKLRTMLQCPSSDQSNRRRANLLTNENPENTTAGT